MGGSEVSRPRSVDKIMMGTGGMGSSLSSLVPGRRALCSDLEEEISAGTRWGRVGRLQSKYIDYSRSWDRVPGGRTPLDA